METSLIEADRTEQKDEHQEPDESGEYSDNHDRDDDLATFEETKAAEEEATRKRNIYVRSLQWLQKHFIITYADKAANTIVLACKKYYSKRVWDELHQQDGAYAPAGERRRAIIDRHTAWALSQGVSPTQEKGKLPYFYASVKLHKNPTGMRYIAASKGTTLSQISSWVSRGLQDILPYVEEIWINCALKGGIMTKGSWIAQDAQTVVNRLNQLNKNHNPDEAIQMEVWDFSTLYTTLDHEDLKSRMREIIDWAFQRAKDDSGQCLWSLVCDADKRKSKWSCAQIRTLKKNEKASSKWFNAEKLANWLDYVVDNTYVTLGNHTFKQRVGLPMGTQCAPIVANLYLLTYELEFLRKTISRGDLDLARRICGCRRYIDDILAIDVPSFRDILYRDNDRYGLYPKETLKLTEEGGSTESITYLDIWIRRDDKGWYSSMYDKRDHIPSMKDNLRFPHPLTRLSRSCKLNTITGQFHRFHRRCTRPHLFVEAAVDLLSRMIKAGYKKQPVLNKAKAFKSHIKGRRKVQIFQDNWLKIKRRLKDVNWSQPTDVSYDTSNNETTWTSQSQ